MLRRAIKIEGADKELEITKSAVIHSGDDGFLYFDELEDKTWRINRSQQQFPDFTKIERFTFKGLELGKLKKGESGYVFLKGTNTMMLITKIVGIPGDELSGFIRFDKKDDGSWHMVYTKKTIPDISKVPGLTMIREGDE